MNNDQYKLRPLEDILDDSPKDWNEMSGEWRNGKRSWVINRYMALLLGDNLYHTFKPITKDNYALNYTHIHSGYYWHESWFEKELIMKFNDEEFLL